MSHKAGEPWVDPETFKKECRYDDPMFIAVNAQETKIAAERSTPLPIAWFRMESGMRVYYETEAWPDMTPLYATPQSETGCKVCGGTSPSQCALQAGLKCEHGLVSSAITFTPEEAAQILKRWTNEAPVTPKDAPIIEKLEALTRG